MSSTSVRGRNGKVAKGQGTTAISLIRKTRRQRRAILWKYEEERVILESDLARVMFFQLLSLLPVLSLEGNDLASRVYPLMSIVYFTLNLNLFLWKKPSLAGLTDTLDHLLLQAFIMINNTS
jgi:hypothetical protein